MFSPCKVGWVATRKSIGRLPTARPMRPSCGLRVGDVHAGEHLDAHRELRPARLVHCAHLAQRAVDAVAHAQEAGLGLQVQVGGTARGGLGEQGVDQAHDELRVARAGDGLSGAAFELAHHVLDRARLAVVLFDRSAEFVVAGQAQFVNVRPSSAQTVEGDDVVGVAIATINCGGRRRTGAAAAVAACERLRHARDRVGGRRRAWPGPAGRAAACGEAPRAPASLTKPVRRTRPSGAGPALLVDAMRSWSSPIRPAAIRIWPMGRGAFMAGSCRHPRRAALADEEEVESGDRRCSGRDRLLPKAFGDGAVLPGQAEGAQRQVGKVALAGRGRVEEEVVVGQVAAYSA